MKDAEKISLAQHRQPDPAILGLARDRISLDVFQVLPQLGVLDAAYGSAAPSWRTTLL